MTFEIEMVDPPDLSKLNWVFDRGRGRVLVRSDRLLDQVPTVTIRATTDGQTGPSGDNVYIELDDGRGRAETAYYEYDEADDKIRRWYYDEADEQPGTVSKEFTYYFDREEILGQYKDGEWSSSGISPGDIVARFGYEDGPSAEATVRFTPPDDASIRDNTRVTDLSFDVQNGTQPTITPTATVGNPTNHGVDYPITVTTQADGRIVNSEDVLIEDLSGSVNAYRLEKSEATLPSVTLPRGTQRATVFIEPRSWAAEFGESYAESVNTDAPVPEDVQIVDCDMAQSQVRAPAEVDMSATVENPTPFRVETELTFSLGGRSETETVVLSPNERYTDRQAVAVLSGGTKQGSVEITRIREIDGANN